MSEKTVNHRVSEVVVAGKDYAEKVKLADVLDRDVLVTGFEQAEGSAEFAKIDPETGEIVLGDYWNITVSDSGVLKTFCTGAVPVDKVLRALQQKIADGEASLPLIAQFKKQGRTFIVC